MRSRSSFGISQKKVTVKELIRNISSYKNFLISKWDEPFSNTALSQNFTFNINECSLKSFKIALSDITQLIKHCCMGPQKVSTLGFSTEL